MGIPMANNLHAPTVPSGSTSGGIPRDLSKLSMADLMKHKERIEEELSALSSVLNSHGVNMGTSLTTFDGFPRDDIDVAQIRTIRAQIIRLRYDHKEVMAHIEKGIHAHFAGLQSSATAGSTPTSSTNGSTTEPSEVHPPAAGTGVLTPFAKVNSVVPGSPAGQAGLQAGDFIRSFGTSASPEASRESGAHPTNLNRPARHHCQNLTWRSNSCKSCPFGLGTCATP
ncbi:hypothetical protein BDV11DRAFT_199708 [Aspergillus similis]